MGRSEEWRESELFHEGKLEQFLRPDALPALSAEPIWQGRQLTALFLVLMGKPYTTFLLLQNLKKYICTAQQQANSVHFATRKCTKMHLHLG